MRQHTGILWISLYRTYCIKHPLLLSLPFLLYSALASFVKLTLPESQVKYYLKQMLVILVVWSWLLACIKLRVEWDLVTVGNTPYEHTWPQVCWPFFFFFKQCLYGRETL